MRSAPIAAPNFNISGTRESRSSGMVRGSAFRAATKSRKSRMVVDTQIVSVCFIQPLLPRMAGERVCASRAVVTLLA